MDKDFFLIKDFAYLLQRNNVDIVTIQYTRNKELVTLSLEGKKVKTWEIPGCVSFCVTYIGVKLMDLKSFFIWMFFENVMVFWENGNTGAFGRCTNP